jgi:hypothetical protein
MQINSMPHIRLHIYLKGAGGWENQLGDVEGARPGAIIATEYEVVLRGEELNRGRY